MVEGNSLSILSINMRAFPAVALLLWGPEGVKGCDTVLDLTGAATSDVATISASSITTQSSVWNACSEQMETNGIAYRILGSTEKVQEVTICSKQTESLLHVWDDCGSPGTTCLAEGVPLARIEGQKMNCQRVIWKSPEDTYVWIAHRQQQFLASDFFVNLKELQPPPNDDCRGAVELNPLEHHRNNPLSGSTGNATLEETAAAVLTAKCPSAPYQSPGVWYTARGTGGIMKVSTCHDGTTMDSRISVFPVSTSGSCPSNLQQCVGAPLLGAATKCDASSGGSVYQWPSIENQLYYILVHGQNPADVGDFQISLESIQDVDNDVCHSPIGPLTLGEKQVGSTLLADPPSNAAWDQAVTCRDDASAAAIGKPSPGVWFTVEGTGTALTVSTCHPETNFDTRLSVLTLPVSKNEPPASLCRKANSWSCVAGVDDDSSACFDNGLASTVSFVSEKHKEYYIYLHGSLESSMGNFGLSVKEGTRSSAVNWISPFMTTLLAAVSAMWM